MSDEQPGAPPGRPAGHAEVRRPRPRRRRGRRLLAAGIAVVVVGGGAAGYLIARHSGSDTGAQPQLQTATARRTELRRTVDAQFTMARSQTFSLKAPSAGTVTRIHLTEGEALPTLQPLVEVNGTAVYGIPSATPFYRDLSQGDSGDDVEALQVALRGAGYDPGDADGDFGSQTVTALEDWQAAKDLDQTGRLALSGFVSFPPGSIVLDLPIAVGDRLGAGGTLATVGGARAMVAQADIDQQDVVQLKTGQQAELTFDAMPDDPVGAKLTTIALDAEAQQSTAGSSNPVEYLVELAPNRLPSTVRAGMTGQVSVTVVDLRNVVVVPTAAVAGTSDQPTVEVLENGITRVVAVVVGLSTSNGVQILAGIQAGQTVVTGVVGSGSAASTQANQGQGGLFGGGAGGIFTGGGGGRGGGGGGGRGGGGGGGGGSGGTGRGTGGTTGGGSTGGGGTGGGGTGGGSTGGSTGNAGGQGSGGP